MLRIIGLLLILSAPAFGLDSIRVMLGGKGTSSYAFPTEYDLNAATVPFTRAGFTADNVSDAIVEAKGIKTFGFDLHYVSGTGLNTTMTNGAFFRVRPGTASSGSYSGYPAAFPLQMPFKCKLYSIVLTFRQAAFDYNATSGPLLFEVELRDHTYNGSTIWNRLLVQFGNFSGSSTPHDTHRYELFKSAAGSAGFSYIAGTEAIDYGKLIGARFVKAPSGDRRINSFIDIVMKLNFEESP